MIRDSLQQIIASAVARLIDSGDFPEAVREVRIEISDTKQPEHGDYACNFAMLASKAAGMNPRQLGELLKEGLSESIASGGPIQSIDVAGPGFLNLRLNPRWVASFVPQILDRGDQIAKVLAPPADAKKINVEFVSVNPNGPITIGSGRGAAYGSTICNVLAAAGNQVHREYYINDGVNSEQMRLFAESVKAIAEGRPVPENGYKGDYVHEVANEISKYDLEIDYQSVPVNEITEDGWYEDYVRRKEEFSALAPSIKWFAQKIGLAPVETSASIWNAPTTKLAFALFDQAREAGVSNFSAHLREKVINVNIADTNIQIPRVSGIWEDFRELFISRLNTIETRYGNVAVITPNQDKSGQPRGPRYSHLLVTKTEEESIHFQLIPFDGNRIDTRGLSQSIMINSQRSALESFGTTFDTWFSEQSLHNFGAVTKEIEKMVASNVADDREIRTVLKLARGGKIDDVEIQDQSGKVEVHEDDEPNTQSSSSEASGNGGKTLWLRSTKFGDDMDRVLRRRDGRLTYIASDVAYHKEKLLDLSGVRGTGPVDKMITILGPDHHGYIGRLQAVVAAMLKADGMVEASAGGDADTFTDIDGKIFNSAQERDVCREALREARQKLEVQIFQLVRFMKDGKPAPMRKRDGNIYALIDLLREIGEKVKPNGSEEERLNAGKDVARFFYLMRSHDTTFDFDLDLAEKQSDENPVFYVQYAYARICSVIAKAEETLPTTGTTAGEGLERLTHERELSLIKKICDLPYEVQRCAENYGVHRLTTYAIELARTYHHFYEACRVIQPEEPELSRARLALCEATKFALKGVLELLGISAPERMDRAE